MTEVRVELPLRIDDAPGGLVIRALCGAEAAVLAPVVADGLRVAGDPSQAGLVRMVLHAQRCARCGYAAAELAAAERRLSQLGGPFSESTEITSQLA